MKMIELVQLAKASKADAFGDVPDARSASIVEAVLAEVRRHLGESKGPVVLAGFGRFVVREAKVTRNGQESVVRRIGFRPGGGRAADAGAGSPADPAGKRAAKAARGAAKAARSAAKAAKKTATAERKEPAQRAAKRPGKGSKAS